MKTRRPYFWYFIFFFVLALILVGLSQLPLFSFLGKPVDFVIAPLQRLSYSITRLPFGTSSRGLETEDTLLRHQLLNQQNLLKENAALKDQFQTATPHPSTLLPSRIIGLPSYLPGISWPTVAIIDKGKTAKVHVGQAVVVKDTIIGLVTAVSDFRAVVSLLSNPHVSFTGKSLSLDQKEAGQSANGVVKGTGDQTFLFDNVLISENLKVSDMVVTKGDVAASGLGIPPDLTVGKIISVDKKPSALFQTAVVKSLLDFSKLQTVFVIVGE